MDDQKRLFLAIVLSGIIIFGWQILNPPPAPTTATLNTSDNIIESSANISKDSGESISTNGQTMVTPSDNIVSFELRHNQDHFILNSDLTMKHLENSKVKMGQSLPEFLGMIQENLSLFAGVEDAVKQDWKWTRINFTRVVDQAPNLLKLFDDQLAINLTLQFTENGLVQYQFNSQNPLKMRMVLKSQMYDAEKDLNEKKRYNLKRDFLVYANGIQRYDINDSDVQNTKNIKWFGVDFNYQLLSFIFDGDQMVSYKISGLNSIIVEPVNPTQNLTMNLFFGDKNYDVLKNLGSGLASSIDFGFFGIVAIPILKLLRFVYSFIPNYGIAILLVTILIRLVVFPLHMKSFKSMKKMQDLKPRMDALKEKYKDDPKRMQLETMQLFKQSGTNPLGGCLPLLAQMPIFFAFYQVLTHAIELVDAPFFAWIHDLSYKDPFYVLPILMTIAMFLQQKMMPSGMGMDETQKKIMLFMPLIFGFIMKDLPSGLTLYMLISTLFGIIQQFYVYRISPAK